MPRYKHVYSTILAVVIVVLAVICFPKYVDKRKVAQDEVKAKLIEATQHHMKEVCAFEIEATGVSFGGIVRMTWELTTKDNKIEPIHGYVNKHTIILVAPNECPQGEDYYLLDQSINRFIPAPALLSDLNEDPFPLGVNQDLGYLFRFVLYFGALIVAAFYFVRLRRWEGRFGEK